MKIRFLGVGGALNTKFIGSSLLINESILIDTPPSISTQFIKYGLDLKKLNNILISHLHGDHYFGLPFLLLEYMLVKRNRQLSIFGPEDLYNNTFELLKLAFPEADKLKLIENSMAQFSKITVYDILNFENNLSVQVINAKHNIKEAFGFLIYDSNKTIYYSSDTEMFDEIFTYIEKADAIIIDGTTKSFTLQGHIALSNIIEIANKFSNKSFYVTHRSDYDEEVHKNIIFPKEGDCFEI
ncbi:MAG: MBL fold metallo-hydrolase [Clostridia bacterium]|nr:MBL fold metallo-hydrolase [Clostridia bacterium]